jgi:hypothetical protein
LVPFFTKATADKLEAIAALIVIRNYAVCVLSLLPESDLSQAETETANPSEEL